MGIAPYEIPPALRATSLFKGGFGRTMFAPTVRSSVWDEMVGNRFCWGRGDVGIAPYGGVSGLWIAYRETIIPRRGEQAACLP